MIDYGYPTCILNYTNSFELTWNLENNATLQVYKQNKTYNSHEFCIETIYSPSLKKNATLAVICDGFCNNESNTCVPYCCRKGMFGGPDGKKCIPSDSTNGNTEWKPRALIEAESRGSGKAVYGMLPECSDRFILDSFNSNLPIKILENGNLDYGKQISFST